MSRESTFYKNRGQHYDYRLNYIAQMWVLHFVNLLKAFTIEAAIRNKKNTIEVKIKFIRFCVLTNKTMFALKYICDGHISSEKKCHFP